MLSKRVLVVDDEPTVLSSLARILRHFGHQVLTAESAKAALEVFATQTVDVVLTDFSMPGCTGAELSQKLRNQNFVGKIICVTGNIELALSTKNTFDRVIEKPFRMQELRQIIDD